MDALQMSEHHMRCNMSMSMHHLLRYVLPADGEHVALPLHLAE